MREDVEEDVSQELLDNTDVPIIQFGALLVDLE